MLQKQNDLSTEEPMAVSSDKTDAKIESYEQQLLTLSVTNAKLNEENDNLRFAMLISKAFNQITTNKLRFQERINEP